MRAGLPVIRRPTTAFLYLILNNLPVLIRKQLEKTSIRTIRIFGCPSVLFSVHTVFAATVL